MVCKIELLVNWLWLCLEVEDCVMFEGEDLCV